jgi:hypothetical protein
VLRRLAPATILFALVLGAAPAAGAPAGLPARDLLPDLVQERPSDLQVSRIRGRHLLGFRSAVHNRGAGPLIIVGRRPSRAVRDMRADQLIRRTDGTTRRRAAVGFLRYVPSADHSHWHFLPFERYELRAEATGRRVARDRKSGFCLGDRYRAEPPVAGARPAALYESRCGLGRPGLVAITEGISVGWGDDYVAYLDGQHIDVTDVPAGRYLLVHRVNVNGTIAESNRANNVATVRIALTRSAGRVRARVLGPG